MHSTLAFVMDAQVDRPVTHRSANHFSGDRQTHDAHTDRITDEREAQDLAAQPASQANAAAHVDGSFDGLEYLVGVNLARLRAERQLSLDALARASSVSRAMLAQVESARIAPLHTEPGTRRAPGTTVNLVVSEGTLEVSVHDRRQLLATGDAIVFDADQPHSLRNPGDTEARVFRVTLNAETPPRWDTPLPGDTRDVHPVAAARPA